MKYKDIYDKVVEQEYQKIQSDQWVSNQDDKSYEWYVMAVAIQMPDKTTEELYRAVHELYPKISPPLFNKLIRAVNLDTIKKRKYISKVVKKTSKEFVQFLDGEKEAVKQVGNYIEMLIERDITDGRMYFKAKYLLTYLFVYNPTLKTRYAKTILENYLEAYCSKLLRNIYKKVLREMGVKMTTKEVMESTKKALEFSREETRVIETADQEKVIEMLQFQVNNYKNTIAILQSMFDELKDSIEESAMEAKNVAVGEFFAALNGSEYGNILDNMVTVEKRLAEMRAEKVNLAPEIMPLAIIFKQIAHFIKDSGIEAIDVAEREFSASYDQIAMFNYQGDPYVDDIEMKTLKVISPGWRYHEIIISLPTVREI